MPLGFISGEGGSSPEDLFRNIPPISKFIVCFMVGSVLFAVVNIFNPMHYAMVWDLVWNKFHIWRFVSCAFYPGMPSFPTLLGIFSMGMYSMRYEIDAFNMGGGGGSADYAFMLIFGLTVIEMIHLTLFYRPVFLIFTAVLFYIMYVWSRKNPSMSVNMWGIIINAVYLPWVSLFIHILIGGDVFQPLLGIASGHLFYFLVDILPDLHDIDLLKTPQFLVNLLGWGVPGSGVQRVNPNQNNAMPAPGVVRPPQDTPRTGRPAAWGSGHTLGSS